MSKTVGYGRLLFKGFYRYSCGFPFSTGTVVSTAKDGTSKIPWLEVEPVQHFVF
jgi:hypothetical protein